MILLLISISSAYANENSTTDIELLQQNAIKDNDSLVSSSDDLKLSDASSDLENKITNAKNKETIIIEPGTYSIHNIQITKNITLQGNGNPRDIIIDGENKSSIFLIRSPTVHVTFKNITFINGLTNDFGGAISIETGNVYVDNCIFINNTALSNTNAGAISNYGTKANKGYLLVNNSLFVNNHADHDGGAITTCYANSYIYNSVFINNSARRDGGAIRVSVFGYGNVQDCIFMYNHADEWGGAYYSWSGESNIERCIFMNNTAGTNGGAVMASGNINIEKSIIVNNNGGETGGSFYIQQPMYNTKTVMNIHDNLITNNTSPYGQEIFIKWWNPENLYTQFDNNDWGDEDPNDSSVIDPNNVTSRSKVSSTITSKLFGKLNVDLLSKYEDLIGDFFPEDSLNELKNQFYSENNDNNQNSNGDSSNKNQVQNDKNQQTKINSTTTEDKTSSSSDTSNIQKTVQSINNLVSGNSSAGNDKKAYELNESKSISKQVNIDIRYFAIVIALVFILLAVGYKRNSKKE